MLTKSEQQDLSDLQQIERNLAGFSPWLYSDIDVRQGDIDGMWLIDWIYKITDKFDTEAECEDALDDVLFGE